MDENSQPFREAKELRDRTENLRFSENAGVGSTFRVSYSDAVRMASLTGQRKPTPAPSASGGFNEDAEVKIHLTDKDIRQFRECINADPDSPKSRFLVRTLPDIMEGFLEEVPDSESRTGPQGLGRSGSAVPLLHGQNPFSPVRREDRTHYGFLDVRPTSNALEPTVWLDVAIVESPPHGITHSIYPDALSGSLTLELGVPELKALRDKIDSYLSVEKNMDAYLLPQDDE